MIPSEAALLARSVLSCARSMTLRVHEERQVLGDDDCDVTTDVHGSPVFSAPEGSALVAASHGGAVGVVEVVSGLSGPGADGHRLDLFLQGTLRQRGAGCGCCGDPRALVGLDLTRVTLFRDDRPVPVDVDLFRDRRHVLNPGYLQRAVEHANDAHGPELRTAIATLVGAPVRSLLAAALVSVDPTGAELAWLDETGAHPHRVDFARAVTSPQELGAALRSHLHAGLC